MPRRVAKVPGRLNKWLRSPAGPTWLSVIVLLAFLSLVPNLIGLVAYERQNRRIDDAVDLNRDVLVRVCDTATVIRHLEEFFVGLAKKKTPDETEEQRRVRLAFLELTEADLKTLSKSSRACRLLEPRHFPE